MVAEQISRIRPARFLLTLVVAAAVVWIGGEALWIRNEAPTGANSIAALRSAVQTALVNRDADAFGRLFAPDAVSRGYPADYLTKLDALRAHAISVTVTNATRHPVLTARGSGFCTAWDVLPDGNRWVLDGVPPAAAGGCG